LKSPGNEYVRTGAYDVELSVTEISNFDIGVFRFSKFVFVSSSSYELLSSGGCHATVKDVLVLYSSRKSRGAGNAGKNVSYLLGPLMGHEILRK
jgi:hypothetical protein